jgi:SAM-dependent methyltransferase
MQSGLISEMDSVHLKMIRENVSKFLREIGQLYDAPGILLDIAHQNYEGAAASFRKAKILTLDINPLSEATYIADICRNNRRIIPDEYFDFVVCTEVLEHTLNPFAAVGEIYRILKPKGLVFISVPFNFRIHGPLPDCWRFTKYGLEVLLKHYSIIQMSELETDGRWLMPIHYTVIAQKLLDKRDDIPVRGEDVPL